MIACQWVTLHCPTYFKTLAIKETASNQTLAPNNP
jgi:hypothetical protein